MVFSAPTRNTTFHFLLSFKSINTAKCTAVQPATKSVVRRSQRQRWLLATWQQPNIGNK